MLRRRLRADGRDSEHLVKPSFAAGRQDQAASGGSRFHPTQSFEPLEDCGADGPGYMRAPFAPVETSPTDRAPAVLQRREFDADFFEKRRAFSGHLRGAQYRPGFGDNVIAE